MYLSSSFLSFMGFSGEKRLRTVKETAWNSIFLLVDIAVKDTSDNLNFTYKNMKKHLYDAVEKITGCDIFV